MENIQNVDILEERDYKELDSLTDFQIQNLTAPHSDSDEEASINLEDSFLCRADSDSDVASTNSITEATELQTLSQSWEDFSSIIEGSEPLESKGNLEDSRAFKNFGFNHFKVPALMVKHPPPAIGRDDDIQKLQEVLHDILLKTDHLGPAAHKILFAPDHKIASNLLKRQETDAKYQSFLPEFPVLHLRKSKITILCSAYKDAGILHILKYMRDEEFQEWKKLISAEHIEMATKYIKRLGTALHISFFCQYLKTMPEKDRQILQSQLMNGAVSEEAWESFQTFMSNGKSKNGTFALHCDMMQHCDEIGQLSLSERMGGKDGYELLLAAVKTSLPFSFTNGALSYAAFTTKLLHEHYKSGTYYQNMKSTLFSTPTKNSDSNFALDTQREIDHKDVLKAFRSGSTLPSVIPRMSLIDAFNEIHDLSKADLSTAQRKNKSPEELLGLKVNDTDTKYITRLVGLILRQGGVETSVDENVYNVYDKDRPVLSNSVLDSNTQEIGHYVIRKFISKANLFGCTASDQPDVNNIQGPKALIQKLKTSKGVTIKRMSIKTTVKARNEREVKEEKRSKYVKREAKKIDYLSSDMNACQAIVKPDCSKPKVSKSVGMKKALLELLKRYVQQGDVESVDAMLLEEKNLVYSSTKTLPKTVTDSVTVATIEFAGVKFKTRSTSGSQYLKYVESCIIMKTKLQLPQLKRLAICEEKYSFTPDDFKAATRSQRHQKKQFSVTHLKTPQEMLSLEQFDKSSIVTTCEGKQIISTYLARNISQIQIGAKLTIDIDSECVISECTCQGQPCSCNLYTNPIRVEFPRRKQSNVEVLTNIQQKKGEAEMSQIDWLVEYQQYLEGSESCASIVTSEDIDSVVLHLFALAYLWPRFSDRRNGFKHDVYIILQKPGNQFDVFNITRILSLLEESFGDTYIGQKLALMLSLGGNDYLPKFHGISHLTTLDKFFESAHFMNDLFQFKYNSDEELEITLNEAVYIEFVKALYTPTWLASSSFTFDEIRQLSIQPPTVQIPRNPQSWMPPKSALTHLGRNINCLIVYYLTAGKHSAPAPNFLRDGCLVKLDNGQVEYDLGPEAHFIGLVPLLDVDKHVLTEKLTQCKVKSRKSRLTKTPLKGRRRKLRPLTSTPRKLEPETAD